MSMGEHAALTAAEWGITPGRPGRAALASHRRLAAAYERGFFDDLMTPYLGLTRDQNLRPDTSLEKLAKLKPVFGDTMTAGNSSALTDGAAVVLLATEEWARRAAACRCWRTSSTETAAVDYVHGGEAC